MLKPKPPEKPEAARPDGRRNTTTGVGRLVAAVLPKPTGEAALLAQLVGQWSALCPGLAAYSYPVRVVKGVLTVCVASPSVGQEVAYQAAQIMRGAELLTGYGGIASVRTTSAGWRGVRSAVPQAPSQAALAAARAKCKNVQDDELRESLARLGAWALPQPK